MYQFEKNDVTTLLCGMCHGADMFAFNVATGMGIDIERYPPDWKKYRLAAGIIRNEQMAKKADLLIAFPGGIGTADMIRRARSYGLELILWEEGNPSNSGESLPSVPLIK